ncbi:MAG: amidohydrolase family protein, partial [bacterium]
MRRQVTLITGVIAVVLGASAALRSQEPGGTQPQGRRFLAPPTQVVAIRAGRLFDARSGAMLNNQVVLIRGDRIADVGPGLQIPRDARVIDLSAATVMPGMIDTHVHVNTGGQTPAQRALIALENAHIDLEAGFTTVLDMDSRGGFNTVDLRDAINAGRVAGPRMQVVGQSLNPRAGTYY